MKELTIMNKQASPQKNKWVKSPVFWGAVAVIGLGFLASLATIQGNWGALAIAFCIFYTIAMTLFFAAQVWGFVVSQTTYSESVEGPKFTLLKLEEAEWG